MAVARDDFQSLLEALLDAPVILADSGQLPNEAWLPSWQASVSGVIQKLPTYPIHLSDDDAAQGVSDAFSCINTWSLVDGSPLNDPTKQFVMDMLTFTARAIRCHTILSIDGAPPDLLSLAEKLNSHLRNVHTQKEWKLLATKVLSQLAAGLAHAMIAALEEALYASAIVARRVLTFPSSRRHRRRRFGGGPAVMRAAGGSTVAQWGLLRDQSNGGLCVMSFSTQSPKLLDTFTMGAPVIVTYVDDRGSTKNLSGITRARPLGDQLRWGVIRERS